MMTFGWRRSIPSVGLYRAVKKILLEPLTGGRISSASPILALSIQNDS